MILEIGGSVGVGGGNSRQDVIVVQSLLNRHMAASSGHLAVDGDFGVHTRAAIIAYQHKTGFAHPDGLIEPTGPTWHALTDTENLHQVHLYYDSLLTDAARWFEQAVGVIAIPRRSAPTLSFFDWDVKPHTDRGGRDGSEARFSPHPGNLCWGAKVSAGFKAKVISICKGLELNPDYLMACMAFETGETFSPTISNAAGSGAVGLIQFMKRTARSLGTTTEALGAMSAEAQLDYVEKFLKPYTGKLHQLEDVYLAILYPKDVGAPDATDVFVSPTISYVQNKGFDLDKDGKVTVSEIRATLRVKYQRGMERGNYG
jgi:hypothetical protein